MNETSMPGRCPSCGGALRVERLHCTACGTNVEGQYRPCAVCTLDAASRSLFDLFLEVHGNLKDVQRTLGVSYPTVRQRVEELFRTLEGDSGPVDAADVLARVRRGELSVNEAEQLLRAPPAGRPRR
jgi:hypothetical protein